MRCGGGVTPSALRTEPAWCTHPPIQTTLGPEVAEVCELAGFAPDANQRPGLDLLFAIGAGGKSLVFEFCLVCCRQNMKTGLLKQASLGWLYVTEQRLIVWSAHEFATAQEAFRDLEQLVTSNRYLERQIKRISRGNGEEAIELRGDRRIIFRARTKGGGRGLSGDKVVLDEAMFLAPGHMGALLPTLASRPDPQVVLAGSAGLEQSAVLRAARTRGRAGSSPRMGYIEYGDDLSGSCGQPECTHVVGSTDCRLDDERRWYRANPSLGDRISVEFLRDQRQAMPPEEFAREHMGWWDDPDEVGADFGEHWSHCIDLDSTGAGRPVMAIDVSPQSRSAAIAAAMRRSDDLVHLELIDHRPGSAWVVDRAQELTERHGVTEWVIDPAGPAGALLPDLDEAGIEPTQMSARDLGQACVALTADAAQQRLRHLGDSLVTTAIIGAGRRDIGDGLWAWSRRRTIGVDIAPLVAVTEAHWLLTQPAQQQFYGAWR